MPDLPSGTVTFLYTDIEGRPSRREGNRSALAAAMTEHIALLDVRTSRV